jgi:hypothetical protein
VGFLPNVTSTAIYQRVSTASFIFDHELLFSTVNDSVVSMARSSSIDLDSPDRPFDNIINFRDVGRTINQFCGAQSVSSCIVFDPPDLATDVGIRILKEGVLFRSARVNSNPPCEAPATWHRRNYES